MVSNYRKIPRHMHRRNYRDNVTYSQIERLSTMKIYITVNMPDGSEIDLKHEEPIQRISLVVAAAVSFAVEKCPNYSSMMLWFSKPGDVG